MKAYLVSGFSNNPEGTNIDSKVFTTLEGAKTYVNNRAEYIMESIKMDLGENICSDKVENVYNSVIKQYRTIEVQINLDKDCDNNFYKGHNLAQEQIGSYVYNFLDLSDRRLTSLKVLDMRITEIEL